MQPSFEFSRWRRFGHDRLYITAGERSLGHINLKDQSAHPEDGVAVEVLRAAAALWSDARPDAARPDAARPDDASPDDAVPSVPDVVVDATEAHVTPAPAAQERPSVPTGTLVETDPPNLREASDAPWTDLALNEPGVRLQQRAREERRAAPIRTFTARALGKHTSERAWRLGAQGEAAVAKAIERARAADPRWHVLHNVPVGSRGADIDHLLIGPGGVICINSKNHPDADVRASGQTVRVNGFATRYIHAARAELARVTGVLSETVGRSIAATAVISIVNAKSVKVTKSVPDVTVVPVDHLDRWIKTLGDVLDEQDANTIFAVARRSTTWID